MHTVLIESVFIWSRPCAALMNVNTDDLSASVPQIVDEAPHFDLLLTFAMTSSGKGEGARLENALPGMAGTRKEAILALFEQG